MPTSARRRTDGAFTLIELLVAISILAMVAVLGYRALDGIVRARVALSADMDQLQGMQLTFAQLQNDCARIATSAELPQRPTMAVGDGRISIVRGAPLEAGAPQFEVVSYVFADGKVSRSESVATRDLATLDALWQAVIQGGAGAPAVALQSDVELVGARVWQNGDWMKTTAPPEPGAGGVPTQAAAPTGLAVELRLKGRERVLSKVFLVGPA